MANLANKGDTINIYLNYTLDGDPITEGSLDEIEFTIGSHRYTLTGGEIDGAEAIKKSLCRFR